MAKCVQCGQSSILLKTTNGICDPCTIRNLRSELSKSQELNRSITTQLKQTEAKLQAAMQKIAAYETVQTITIESSDSGYDALFQDPFVRRTYDTLIHAKAQADRAPTQAAKIERLQQFIDLFDTLQSECRDKGAQYTEWFEKQFCNNYPYREHAVNRLQECIASRDAGVGDMFDALNNLGCRIIDAIRAQDGILQRDLGKQFDLNVRNHVRNMLYQLEQCGAIRRERNGSSYNLHLINNGAAFTALIQEPRGNLLDEIKFCRFCSYNRPVYENHVCAVCRHSVL